MLLTLSSLASVVSAGLVCNDSCLLNQYFTRISNFQTWCNVFVQCVTCLVVKKCCYFSKQCSLLCLYCESRHVLWIIINNLHKPTHLAYERCILKWLVYGYICFLCRYVTMADWCVWLFIRPMFASELWSSLPIQPGMFDMLRWVISNFLTMNLYRD